METHHEHDYSMWTRFNVISGLTTVEALVAHHPFLPFTVLCGALQLALPQVSNDYVLGGQAREVLPARYAPAA